MEPVAQATDDDGLICAASVTQNRPKLNHANLYCADGNRSSVSKLPTSST